MTRYNIQGMGGRFWIQERVLCWWVDVWHYNPLTGCDYRREFDTLDDAFVELTRLRAQDFPLRWLCWLRRRGTRGTRGAG